LACGAASVGAPTVAATAVSTLRGALHNCLATTAASSRLAIGQIAIQDRQWSDSQWLPSIKKEIKPGTHTINAKAAHPLRLEANAMPYATIPNE
jgi:hypothetical protein